ncbi:MAG: hypothetical protein OMM_05323 [Candidatus Magnetoglobus multicellularis str. Araruama]|uniref:DUF4184 family protein n=1 Tax=Candidatus Magnetoglobus multicellularis str. Araruama TaxID=890399 RepID=A0A1V1NX08_9BACT|nr:MAG: hypothetical protein OMM_05323 [Candidatus Magnetoglobus multicellularis str. Araruama]
MPFTPFHFGPGIALKSLLRNWFSLSIFIISQILIDIEPLFYLFHGQYPLHRFFHTYLGATFVVLICIIIGRPVCQKMLRFWNGNLNKQQEKFLYIEPFISWKATIISSIIGSYSHVFLDSLIYYDVKPFEPFSTSNILVDTIFSVKGINIFCIICGIFGLIIFLMYFLKAKVRISKK